jgi:hypothetical protein
VYTANIEGNWETMKKNCSTGLGLGSPNTVTSYLDWYSMKRCLLKEKEVEFVYRCIK